MDTVFISFLSMSVSAELLILILLAAKRLLKDKTSRQWQYYIWLVAVLRLLLPFGLELDVIGRAYPAIDRAVTQAVPFTPQGNTADIPDNSAGAGKQQTDAPVVGHTFWDPVSLLPGRIWPLWLAVALGLLIRKITVYQSFVRFLSASSTPVSDINLLDRLSAVAEQMDIKKPVELCVNPLVSSPLLTGFFHPCVVLPRADIPENDLRFILLHELTHYKRRDMFYKWLVQAAVCLHWFNPLVHLMCREITKECEFSCDEAVVAAAGCANAQRYAQALLNAMSAVGAYRENLGSITLSENKQLLKERLGAIMDYKKKPKAVRLLTAALTLCLVFLASFLAASPAAAAAPPKTVPASTDSESKDALTDNAAGKYYEAGSLPLFQLAFSRMDEDAQGAWLDKIYADRDIAFFSVCLDHLDADNPMIDRFAERTYKDSEIAFFSVLTGHMEKSELELWLDRALEDGEWSFQSVLFDRLNMGNGKDALEDEMDKKQMEEYKAFGVTKKGKSFYYNGKLVNIFLDQRADSSFYYMEINPVGSVNVKTVRNADNEITGMAYMTDAEVAELGFGEDED